MESRKRKRSPCKDQKENEKLPIRKIAKREKCVPILPDESKKTDIKPYFIQFTPISQRQSNTKVGLST